MLKRKFDHRAVSIAIAAVCFFPFTSCNETASGNGMVETTAVGKEVIIDEKTPVKIIAFVKSDFSKEIISNGKLEAIHKAHLKFTTSERIRKIYFKNGDYVKQGDVIAELDDFMLANALKQSESRFEQVKFDLRDILIGQGVKYSDQTIDDIAPEILKVAKIKSGYDKAFFDLELARYNLANSKLRAPFSGLIANLDVREENFSNPGEFFCTVIDNKSFEATFRILEFEMGLVRAKQKVTISPFSKDDVSLNAEISKINPIVDDDGLVEVRAACVSLVDGLFEGMNVKVVIAENLGAQLVVPKNAVVLRNERQVVFTFNNGKAKWNYVKTRFENSTSYVVSEGLSEGDSVIVEGNFNLVHNAPCVVTEN